MEPTELNPEFGVCPKCGGDPIKSEYYLYRYENVWDKDNQRPKKKTEYLGSLKRNGRSVFKHGHVVF